MRIAIVVLLTMALEMPSTTTGDENPVAVNAGMTEDEIAVPAGRTSMPRMLGAAKA